MNKNLEPRCIIHGAPTEHDSLDHPRLENCPECAFDRTPEGQARFVRTAEFFKQLSIALDNGLEEALNAGRLGNKDE